MVDYFLLNVQEFKACTGQTFVLLWQSRRPKGRKQRNFVFTHIRVKYQLHVELYQPITVVQEKTHKLSPRAILMV